MLRLVRAGAAPAPAVTSPSDSRFPPPRARAVDGLQTSGPPRRSFLSRIRIPAGSLRRAPRSLSSFALGVPPRGSGLPAGYALLSEGGPLYMIEVGRLSVSKSLIPWIDPNNCFGPGLNVNIL